MYIYNQYYQKEIFSTKIDNFEQSLKDNLINEIFEEFDTNINDYLVDDHLSMATKENLDSLYNLYHNFEKELAQKPMYLFHLNKKTTIISQKSLLTNHTKTTGLLKLNGSTKNPPHVWIF